METLLCIALLAPFACAIFLPALGARWGARVGLVALLAPLTSLGGIVALLARPVAERLPVSWAWVPSLGVNLTFAPDGLALFYGLVVAGVGVLVVAYAVAYLDDHHYRDHGKFYCYLLLFMGAMLATVFSSNLLVLFVAWELTGITSFLLIGFLHEKAESRRGARMALLTTGLTGLALLAGIVLLRLAYGSFELAEIVARVGESRGALPVGSEGLVTAAFVCCFLGIAGKSAQFPFHYWLPNAMAAPTPVSAYLHSATMVKLGVFLTARLLPVFSDLPAWTPTLVVVGFGTLLLGAVLALLSPDLKGVLAYTTVAQLGLLVGHYGLYAGGAAVRWDYVHILNHVFYKACLFMVVGIIDHSTGTRDLRQLGGLARKMPLTALAAAITLAALAGLPFTTGFLSKEMLLKSLTDFWRATDGGALALWALGCTLLASVVKVAVALGVWRRAFAGAPSRAVEAHYHAPSVGLQLSPLLLAAGALGFGVLAPQFGVVGHVFGVPGMHATAAQTGELHLWPGFTLELGLSALVTVLGLGLYAAVGARRWAGAAIPRALRVDALFDPLVEGVQAAGKKMNQALGFETPYAHLLIIAGVMVTAVAAFLVPEWSALRAAAADWALWPHHFVGLERWVLVALMSAAALAACLWKSPLKQVIALSVVGLGVTFYYVLYSAPDLALTQLLVETATLLLVLFVVLRFKRDGADRAPLTPMAALPRAGRAGLAALFGLMLGGGVLVFQGPRGVPGAPEYAGDWYLAHTLALAQGQNAVNTVVIDFRGWDTLLEITVLIIAALGCLGLLHRARRADAGTAQRSHPEAARGGLFPVPYDLILRYVAIGACGPLNIFAVHLFLRGHNAPGGGFVAGLVTAISLLLLTFAIGVHGVRRLVRVNPLALALVGVGLALSMAILPTLRGLPVFSHFHAYIFGGFYVGAPFWFDLGVYLTVVGAVLKLILPLMKSVHALPAFVAEEEGRFAERLSEPIDLPPARRIDAERVKGGSQ
jgi:NADH:ubiquinone oxidoreductase subunit 5 (subunit L)/multisubunit Na+/H+ antiporter MnhA subunit